MKADIAFSQSDSSGPGIGDVARASLALKGIEDALRIDGLLSPKTLKHQARKFVLWRKRGGYSHDQ